MSTVAQEPLNRLQGLLVSDVMTRDIAVIPETATMDDAAAILIARGASGAPVVNHRGRCIGVLSTTDFVCFDERDAKYGHYDTKPDGGVDRWELPWKSVQRYMTAPVHAVSPAAPMIQAAELMCAEHIHRLIVLDDRETPVGLVSTLDIVSALIHAVDEDRQQHRPREWRN